MGGWPPPVYRLRVLFRAPLLDVYRWCTDYQRDDEARAGATLTRRVLNEVVARSPSKISGSRKVGGC